MKKLINGISEFRASLTDEKRALFAKLALGQKPDALFIACSDSRVVPNLFASTNPGDLFVLRNMGNLVPSASSTSLDSSVSAVLEFSIFSLKVLDIVVCGHSECGAIQSLIEGVDRVQCPHMYSWLKHGEGSIQQFNRGFILDPTLAKHNQISQINVLEQIKHLMSYPFIQERVKKKQLRIHGWWFDIAQADVYCYEQEFKRFILMDEKEVQVILKTIDEKGSTS
jgi:carbonic anhydrase